MECQILACVRERSLQHSSAGVEGHEIEGVTVQVTSPARSVVDCFKFRNKIGVDVAVEALRGLSPSEEGHRRRPVASGGPTQNDPRDAAVLGRHRVMKVNTPVDVGASVRARLRRVSKERHEDVTLMS